MRNHRLQGQITAGRWTLPVVVFICTFCWLLTSFVLPELTRVNADSSMLWQSARSLLLPDWADRIVSYLIYAFIGYFLIEINNQFSIIRMRASVQTVFYFMLVTICPEMHLLYAGDIAAVAFLLSTFFLLKSDQHTNPSGYLFYSFFFIGGGSIFFPQLSFLIVLWLLEAYRFKSLNFRSFCAAILGWMIPYWLLFGHAVFYNQMEVFYHPFAELVTFEPLFNLQRLFPWELATLGYLFVLFAVSTGHCFFAGFEDKRRTRSYLQFIINVTFCLFLLIVLQPSLCNNILPLLMITNSILMGHFFALTSSKLSNLFFIVSMSCLILLFGFNIWTLL